MSHTALYGEDLTRVHIEGYGFHWEGAAKPVLALLRKAGIHDGLVVDMGCGGGQWMACLAAKGYDVCGVDVSPEMIRQARRRVPDAQFLQGSMCSVKIPACTAITSLGEPINYLPSRTAIRRVLRNAFRSLNPGGVMVFDAREPVTVSTEPRTVARCGIDWACVATIAEDPRRQEIVRDITTFLRSGKLYRRRHEVHRLKVVPRDTMLRWLRETGFRVRRLNGYGDYRLSARQSVFVARKPVR